jgi:hypothetical protein
MRISFVSNYNFPCIQGQQRARLWARARVEQGQVPGGRRPLCVRWRRPQATRRRRLWAQVALLCVCPCVVVRVWVWVWVWMLCCVGVWVMWGGVGGGGCVSCQLQDCCCELQDCCCLRACERLRLRGHGVFFFYLQVLCCRLALWRPALVVGAAGEGGGGGGGGGRREGSPGRRQVAGSVAQKERYRKRE